MSHALSFRLCFVEVGSLGDISQDYTECQIAHGDRVINIQGTFVTVNETVSKGWRNGQVS